MGLSAAQARLLSITSRKSDCEFQSMRYSHEKIALSRDLTNVSNEYQNALETTKLVFDYYNTGSEANPLSYSVLMTPSELNTYMPMLTTTEAGRVVLDGRYAAAARAAGIPAEGLSCLPSSMIRDKFYDAMTSQGIISQDIADECKNVQYSQEIGVGASDVISVDIQTEDMSLTELINYISATTEKIDFSDIYDDDYRNNKGTDGGYCLYAKSGSVDSAKDATSKTVSFKDLFNDNYILYTAIDCNRGGDDQISALYNLDKLKNAKCWDQILDALNNTLGTDDVSKKACEEATSYVKQVLGREGTTQISQTSGGDGNNGPSDVNGAAINGLGYFKEYDSISCPVYNDDEMVSDAITGANNHIGYAAVRQVLWFGSYYKRSANAGFVNRDKSGDAAGGSLAISVSNIIKAYLTNYMYYVNEAIGEDKEKYKACDLANRVKFKESYHEWGETGLKNGRIRTTNTSLTTTNLNNIKGAEFKVVKSSSLGGLNCGATLMSGAYDALFNQICLRGWTENEQINDNNYLQEMYKSGKYFLTTCNDDGYYYQGTYTSCSLIQEVTDEEAIAKAEAKYNTEKQKINYKEEIIDLKMKNLDTEISALTTEYDTVKSLITKNIEKGFKRYDA